MSKVVKVSDIHKWMNKHKKKWYRDNEGLEDAPIYKQAEFTMKYAFEMIEQIIEDCATEVTKK